MTKETEEQFTERWRERIKSGECATQAEIVEMIDEMIERTANVPETGMAIAIKNTGAIF